MNKLEGKTALITGGTSGIGLATAKAFVNEGAYVFITGRREPELAATAKEIGRNVTGIEGNRKELRLPAALALRNSVDWANDCGESVL
jgi:NAD(P)-dependent dehydrogenase (short-subunit alcohol dehydrogenase family)